jgi:N-acetyl sugar amidotransferase
MKPFPRTIAIDYDAYSHSDPQPKPSFGLPEKVAFCSRCVISNQRPNAAPSEFDLDSKSQKSAIGFDEEGICDACRVWEMKHETIDWSERERELVDLLDRHRRNDGRYDCIIPGSGGKDSFVQAHILKTKYNMHPLTVTWAPHMYTDWGWKNMQAWIHAGFDNVLVTPNGRIHRLLTRIALENMFHPFQPFVFGQKVLPARLAAQYDIPLGFYGDHGAEWGLPKEKAKDPVTPRAMYVGSGGSINFGGLTSEQLTENFYISDADLKIYQPLETDVAAHADIEIHQLGYYLNWHPQGNYYYAAEHGFNAAPERTPGTYSKYASIDDKMDDFNFYTYFIKFGIGRATYDAAQEVRARDIDRDEGVSLVKKYDGEFPERFAEEIFEYLSLPEAIFPEASKMFEQPKMDREYFNHLADRYRSPHLWQYENENWSLRHTVFGDA